MDAEILKKRSYGRLLERTWLTNKEVLCFFDFYFIGKSVEEPIIYGGWVFSQAEYRRFILKIEDLYVLLKEVEYVMNGDDSNESELNLPIFESRCLDKLTEFDPEIIFHLSKEKSKLLIEVRSHPLVSTSYVVQGRLFKDWLEHVLNKWCSICPAYKFMDLWVLPLGSMFAFYNDETEFYISDEGFYELEYVLDLGIDYVFSFGKVTYTDELVLLSLYNNIFEIDRSNIDMLMHFMKQRMFLSEVGNYVEWSNKKRQKTKFFAKRLDQYDIKAL